MPMVAFEVSRYPEPGYYSEYELSHESNLYRLIERSEALPGPGEIPPLNGRIRINFEVGSGLTVSDDLSPLVGNLCSKAAAKLASGKMATVSLCSHYGSLLLQPLNNYVFISGDVDDKQDGLFSERAFVCSRESLLKGLADCYARYQAFCAKLKTLAYGAA